jgi:hypothetical protein
MDEFYRSHPELEQRSRQLSEQYINMLFNHKMITLIERAEYMIELKGLCGKVAVDIWKSGLIATRPIIRECKLKDMDGIRPITIC